MPIFPLEAGLAVSLWDLFSSDGPRELALRALLGQLPRDDDRVQRFENIVRERGSRAWLPRRRPGSDLALITPDDADGVADVLAFIEIKAGAAANWPLMESALKLPSLAGATAEAIRQNYEVEDAQVICQIDLYRSRAWWHDVDGIRLSNPEQALWLVFDTCGRTTREAFPNSVSASSWMPVNLKQFADDLRKARESHAVLPEHYDAIAVVLWHIDQAPAGETAPTGEKDKPSVVNVPADN